MNQEKQPPEAMVADARRLAYVADQVRALETAGSECDVFLTEAADVFRSCADRIADLEAQLSAIGAGGVEALRKRECLQQSATVTPEKIRDVFLAHGFTIKPGMDDLKPYVYEAALALLALQAAPPAPSVVAVPERVLPDGVVPVAEVLSSRPGNDTSTIDKAFAAGTKLFTAAQVLAMGRVPIDAEAIEMAQAVRRKLKALRKKDVPMDAYVLLTDAQYVIERLGAAAPRPPAAQEPNQSNSAELAREPLTRQQVDKCFDGLMPSGHGKSRYDIARAIEAAHGITHPTGD